ncbi:VOC family protein [Rhodococcus sp. USK10]|uniref:Catechol 2,3-dioxygenase n=1 Tax=Rhodococcus wratislaviensis TaxID=44752 RepID=A0A402CK18_RHOWR|nr:MULTISPECIES: VOC family protein [Rhodococcus]QYB02237.1 VOC family protein [Rhodococcus sp. USK10]GCE43956.1 Catechol 2,3-dioxygenase [Rhodococcus wratislaviensis]
MSFPSVHPITHVRSVTIAVEELATASNFYRDLWQLDLVTKDDGKAYFGTGCADNYAIKLRENDVAGIELTTFDVTDRAGVDFLAKRVADSGAQIIREPGDRSDFGGGYSCIFFDCDGRAIELAAEIDQRIFREVEAGESRPKFISHVVFNTANLQKTIRWYGEVLGFKISDWLQDFFCFMRTGRWHHIIAFAQSKNTSLNHVSFELYGIDEFMRGTGRMMRAGHQPLWGPGRHGAGDNTYSYFQEPSSGFVMEYTTALQVIDEEHGWTPKVWGTSLEEQDQWGTANVFDEVILAKMAPSDDPVLWTPPQL